MRLFVLFAIIILLFGCASTGTSSKNETKNIIQERPSLGKAPDFELEDLNGKIVKLSDFRGQKVIVNFFATWCPPCKEEMPLFERVHKENPEIVFVAINLQEDAETVRNFIKGMNITYIILLDPESKAKRDYKLITQPQTYFIDDAGNLVDKKVGVYTEEEFIDKFEAFRIKNIAAVGTKEPKEDEIKEKDGVKYIVDPDTITTVLNKDAIPSLTNPNFETISEADGWLNTDDIGVGVSRNGVTRFYPFRIMSRHEIVNDFFGNEPVIVNYCPLCRTAIVFNRQVDGQVLEFGVSGKLYNSEVVMYDRKTNSYWLQTPGKAVVGELTGKIMKRLPSDVSTYGDWKASYPNTQVLSKNTGHLSSYNYDPYEDYYSSSGV